MPKLFPFLLLNLLVVGDTWFISKSNRCESITLPIMFYCFCKRHFLNSNIIPSFLNCVNVVRRKKCKYFRGLIFPTPLNDMITHFLLATFRYAIVAYRNILNGWSLLLQFAMQMSTSAKKSSQCLCSSLGLVRLNLIRATTALATKTWLETTTSALAQKLWHVHHQQKNTCW